MPIKLLKYIHVTAFALLLSMLPAGPVPAAQSDDPDWPCVQRKVPSISAGMVWAGPPLDELQADWRQDVEVAQLAGTLSRRRVELADAERMIADFAAGLAEDRNVKLTLLFAGLLDIVNRERSEIMEGIGRYARRQQALADGIRDKTASLRALPDGDGARADLEEQIQWDTRIYQDREQSLTYVCETPVLLEQRLFALSRAIMNHLE